MTRRQAVQVAVDFGGEVGNGVTKRTNFLVVGGHDYRTLAEGQTKSNKMRKAESLLSKGHDTEVLSEEEFLQMIGL